MPNRDGPRRWAGSKRCPVSAVMGLRERKKLEAWRTIRSTALALISERGFDAVSVEDIAGAAGVSRTTFFSYFPSKEAVVFDLDPLEVQQWRDLLADPRADLPLWEALTDVSQGRVEAIIVRGSPRAPARTIKSSTSGSRLAGNGIRCGCATPGSRWPSTLAA